MIFFLQKLTSPQFNFKESLNEGTTIIKDPKTPKTLNDGVFKKPLLPKRNVKKFREPEKLAYWYDGQEKFGMYSCTIDGNIESY